MGRQALSKEDSLALTTDSASPKLNVGVLRLKACEQICGAGGLLRFSLAHCSPIELICLVLRSPAPRSSSRSRRFLRLSVFRRPAPILDRLRDMGCLDLGRALQIGDGAGEFEDAVIGAG
jgi:hypothetical protein